MKTVIKVNGMMCGHCKAHVETACKGVPGVTDAVADLDAKNVTVTGDAESRGAEEGHHRRRLRGGGVSHERGLLV